MSCRRENLTCRGLSPFHIHLYKRLKMSVCVCVCVSVLNFRGHRSQESGKDFSRPVSLEIHESEVRWSVEPTRGALRAVLRGT